MNAVSVAEEIAMGGGGEKKRQRIPSNRGSRIFPIFSGINPASAFFFFSSFFFYNANSRFLIKPFDHCASPDEISSPAFSTYAATPLLPVIHLRTVTNTSLARSKLMKLLLEACLIIVKYDNTRISSHLLIFFTLVFNSSFLLLRNSTS